MQFADFRRLGVKGIVAIAARRALLRLMAARHRALTIVQIGGYVGPSGSDPLWRFFRIYFDPTKPTYRPEYRAVIVEPVEEYFEQLRSNYASFPNIQFEKAAITSERGVKPFYRIAVNPSDYGMPQWYDQLGSLSPARIDALPDEDGRRFLRDHQIVEQVECLTVNDLLRKHQVAQLDILQIDAEGAEWDILRALDLREVRPLLINYERILLGENQELCRQTLRRAGYSLVDWELDTLAIRRARKSPL